LHPPSLPRLVCVYDAGLDYFRYGRLKRVKKKSEGEAMFGFSSRFSCLLHKKERRFIEIVLVALCFEYFQAMVRSPISRSRVHSSFSFWRKVLPPLIFICANLSEDKSTTFEVAKKLAVSPSSKLVVRLRLSAGASSYSWSFLSRQSSQPSIALVISA